MKKAALLCRRCAPSDTPAAQLGVPGLSENGPEGQSRTGRQAAGVPRAPARSERSRMAHPSGLVIQNAEAYDHSWRAGRPGKEVRWTAT